MHPRGGRRSAACPEYPVRISSSLQVREHDLANQTMERAATPHDGEAMVGKVLPEKLKKTINPRKV